MNKTIKPASNLLKIIDTIEAERFDIAQKWVVIPSVKNIFDVYKIPPEKFKNSFAVQIIEYFISVVRGQKEPGNCPVMSSLVKYLIEKDITPREVFLICMGLRKILVIYTLSKDVDSSKVLLDEFAEYFDANVGGTLDTFTLYYQRQLEVVHEAQQKNNKLNLFSKIINSMHTKIILVKDAKIISANKSFFRLSSTSNLEEFYKYIEDDNVKKIEGNDSKYTLSTLNSWIKEVCKKENSFNVKIFHQKYNKLYTYNARVTELDDMDGLKYMISFNNVSDLIEENAQLKSSLKYDKLTGFYNYVEFESLLNKARVKAKETNEKATLAIIDMPELRTKYTECDNAQCEFSVKEVADRIKNYINEDIHVARINESRFALYIPIINKQSCYDWCSTLLFDLNKGQNRVTMALSLFDVAEDENVSMLNIFGLIEKANKTTSRKVVTDLDGIKEFELLEDQNKFISLLSDVKQFDMTVYYKELPVVSRNSFIESDNTSVRFTSTKKQLNTIKLNSKIYFQLKFIGDIEAEVKEIDESNKQIVIHNFRRSKSSPIQRTMFRVKAEDNIIVEIEFEDDVYISKLIDLNLNTMAVLIENKNNLSEGDKIEIKTLLTIKDKPHYIVSSGRIIKVDKIDKNKKLIIDCDYDSETESHILEYISMRQMDIVKEIRDINK